MKIYYGLKSGAVLQRDTDNLCKCFFKADADGEIRTSLGKIEKCDGLYVLKGIPVGGPYEIELCDDKGSVTLTDVYVGDLWLLAGQSNMEGSGKWRDKHKAYDRNPEADVRAYYMNESWDAARSQLHQLWESADACISVPYREGRKSRWGNEFPEVQNNGVGPGLYFALEMKRLTDGIPQGVIPCGIGGSALWQWNPAGENNYYTAAKRRFHECGGNINGIFWHQGEAQAHEGGCNAFVSDMKELVSSMRKDFEGESLPFVQVQINKYVSPGADDFSWTKLRELQRTLSGHIENLATVYSVDSELDDLIHLSSESQETIGKRAAEAMHLLVTGNGIPSPDFDSFEIIEDDYVPFFVNIRVNFKNLKGGLTANGVPNGFAILESENGKPMRAIARTCLEADSVRLKVELDPANIENYYVCYAYGNDFYCNITDEGNRSLPGFGPFKLKDYLKKGE